ncbi:hypothetical protein [Gayadomonas joobiniege]|uniref:hypothetical protein n=1 Tax=Gayadomonas joobiniege TaxID=1234606 RepID=UPI0003757937|nr:hypothetical protein [Gayadomonas joobiniege]
MNLDNLKNHWQHHHSACGSEFAINEAILWQVKINKQMTHLNQMKWARIFESCVFLLIIFLLGQYIADNLSVSASFISASILIIFAIVGFAGNIGQIVLISKVDYANPVSQLQKDMFRVCSHKLQLTKLLLMSAPFYFAYVFIGFDVLLGVDLFKHLTLKMICFYSFFSVFLFFVMAVLLTKLDYKNISVVWVKNIINFVLGPRLVSLAQFVNKIDSNER